MPDPYDNPYSDPYSAAQETLPPVSNPGAADAAATQAGAFAAQHRAAIQGRERDVRDAQEKQQLNVDTMTQMLDDTVAQIKRAREGRSNLGLLEMGGAMMASPGNFGQQLGAGMLGLSRGIRAQREEDIGTELKLGELNLRRAAIANAPLEQRLAYMKALQTGDLAALARIEAMQVRAQGAGSDPAIVKEWRAWQKEPGNENKPLAEYQKFKAGLTDRGTAFQREFDAAKEAEPGLTWEQFVQKKAAAGASGKAQGDVQGTSRANFGSYEQNASFLAETIDKMISHPGIENAVGKLWATVPGIAGTPKADFEAMEQVLLGQVFLSAYADLRGGGAITEAEGLKATASRLAASRKQSKEAYLENLKDFQRRLAEGREIMRAKAGLPAGEKAGSTTPISQAPTPPGQTGQTPPTGPRARMPDGSFLVIRDGKWVPE